MKPAVRLVVLFLIPALYVITCFKVAHIVSLHQTIPEPGVIARDATFAGLLLVLYLTAVIPWLGKPTMPLIAKVVAVVCQVLMAIFVFLDWFGRGM